MNEKIKPKLILLIDRSNYIAHFDGLLRQRELKDQIELWCDVATPSGPKSYLAVDGQFLKELSHFSVRTYVGEDGLKECVEAAEPSVFFSLHSRRKYRHCNFGAHIFVRVQQLLDSFTYSDGLDLVDCDYFFGASDYWLELVILNLKELKECGPELEAELRRKFRAVSLLKVSRLMQRDEGRIKGLKKKYSIDPNKRVILLLPTPIKGLGYWAQCFGSKTMFGRALYHFKDLAFNRAREYFDEENRWNYSESNHAKLHATLARKKREENATIIVKQRKKNEIHPDVEDIADQIFYDESHLDPIIYDLLCVADVCVHFDSAVVFEAAKIGVFSISLKRPPYSRLPKRAKEIWRRANAIPNESMLSFDGVSLRISLSDDLTNLAKISLTNHTINQASRIKYLNAFCGLENSSQLAEVVKEISREVKYV